MWTLRTRPVVGPIAADIILEMRAIGRADFDEPGSGARHDLGHAKGAADLDQLAARNHGLAAMGERIERQQHGSSIVVDDGGVLGARQFAEQAAQVVIALAAPSVSRSNSSATASRMAERASIAASAMSARPRLV